MMMILNVMYWHDDDLLYKFQERTPTPSPTSTIRHIDPIYPPPHPSDLISSFPKPSYPTEFMTAATDLFGKNCLLQFEDFNSNDAFPLLESMRDKFLCYNDDIQGTAAVAVAGILGAIKVSFVKKWLKVFLLCWEITVPAQVYYFAAPEYLNLHSS
jgi:hypothetical protein